MKKTSNLRLTGSNKNSIQYLVYFISNEEEELKLVLNKDSKIWRLWKPMFLIVIPVESALFCNIAYQLKCVYYLSEFGQPWRDLWNYTIEKWYKYQWVLNIIMWYSLSFKSRIFSRLFIYLSTAWQRHFAEEFQYLV